MKAKTKLFVGGFLITIIFIGALCGFMVVDLSTDRYMPGRIGPMFAVSAVNAQGIDFAFMGGEYHISASPLRQSLESLTPYRGLLPLHIQVAQALGEVVCAGAQAEE